MHTNVRGPTGCEVAGLWAAPIERWLVSLAFGLRGCWPKGCKVTAGLRAAEELAGLRAANELAGLRAAEELAGLRGCTHDSSSQRSDHRPRGPDPKPAATAADREGHERPPEPAEGPAAREKTTRRKRGGYKHGRSQEDRVKCRVCYRWVNSCPQAQTQHRSSKYCLSWYFYEKGWKWAAAEKIAEEATQDKEFLRRLTEKTARPREEEHQPDRADSREPSPERMRERRRERRADSRARSSGASRRPPARSRSRTRRPVRDQRDAVRARTVDSRASRDHEVQHVARRSGRTDRGDSRESRRKAEPVTREHVSASKKKGQSETEESEYSPEPPPKKPAGEEDWGLAPGCCMVGIECTRADGLRSCWPMGRTYFTAVPPRKAAGKAVAAPALPASSGSTDVDRTEFVKTLLATAIESGLQTGQKLQHRVSVVQILAVTPGSQKTSRPRLCAPSVALKVDAVYNKSHRVDLRYTCKACHALLATFQRRGLQLQSVLSEGQLVKFLVEAKEERSNCEGGRLAFAKGRTMLKKHMVEETLTRQSDSNTGEWQPLSFWELRGYDTAKIQAEAPWEDHALLGRTYKVAVHKDSTETVSTQMERRLVELEEEALRKKSTVASAPGVPLLDLPEVNDVAKGNNKRKAATPEEKEAAKQARAEQRKAEADYKTAAAAAVKFLPLLKGVLQKLADKKTQLGDLLAQLPDPAQEHMDRVATDLTDTVAKATQLLDKAAKGQSLLSVEVTWKKEKELQAKLREGNAAVRTLQDFKRSQKENAAPKAKAASGKSKKK
eukprot:Skav201060  [mRNA]  locus=scaffold2848:87266:90539:- [translate_table: standard]